MKILVGLALLFGLFGVAAVAQDWMFESLEREHEATREVAALETGAGTGDMKRDPGWGAVVIGRPSGAEPVAPPPRTETPPRRSQPLPSPEILPLPERRADFELIVGRGDRLWTLVERHYGAATPDRVERVAAYNGMANANRLGEGDTLRFPPLEVLETPGP